MLLRAACAASTLCLRSLRTTVPVHGSRPSPVLLCLSSVGCAHGCLAGRLHSDQRLGAGDLRSGLSPVRQPDKPVRGAAPRCARCTYKCRHARTASIFSPGPILFTPASGPTSIASAEKDTGSILPQRRPFAKWGLVIRGYTTIAYFYRAVLTLICDTCKPLFL